MLLADDHARYLAGLGRTLEEAGLRVVGRASTGTEALELARRLRPDLAVVDLRMPGLSGAALAAQLRREGSQVPVVVVSAYDEAEIVAAAFEAGARGFVSKAAPRRSLLAVVEGCLRGEVVVLSGVDPALVRHALGDDAGAVVLHA